MRNESRRLLILLLLCNPLLAVAMGLEQAESIFKQGRYDQARQALLTLVQEGLDKPEAEKAELIATLCLYGSGDYERFALEAESFRSLYPECALLDELDYKLAMTAFHEGRWEQARADLSTFTGDYPGSTLKPRARYHAACCAYNGGDYAQYSTLVEDFRADYPDSPLLERLEYNEALVDYHLENWEGTLAKLDAFQQKYPGSELSEQVTYHTALVSYHLRDWDAACDLLRQFVELHPDSSLVEEAEFHVAHAKYLSGYKGRSFEEFENLVAAYKTDHPGSRLEAVLDFDQATKAYHRRDWEEAVVELQWFLNSRPDAPNALEAKLMLGRSWMGHADELRHVRDRLGEQACREEGREILAQFRSDASGALGTRSNLSAQQCKHVEFLALESWHLEGEHRSLAEAARQYISDHAGDPERLVVGKIWLGTALAEQSPADLDGAAQVFDDLLAAADVETALIDHVATRAALWRASIAHRQGDVDGLRRIVQTIEQMPDSLVKRQAMTQFGSLIR